MWLWGPEWFEVTLKKVEKECFVKSPLRYIVGAHASFRAKENPCYSGSFSACQPHSKVSVFSNPYLAAHKRLFYDLLTKGRFIRRSLFNLFVFVTFHLSF